MPDRQPTADRPAMPGYGIATDSSGLLPWSWATDRLSTGHGYWVATTDADGAPHLAAVWGVWFDDAICFSTGGESHKARNLARDPRCSVTTGDATESLVVRGIARRLTDADTVDRVRLVYIAKYGEGFPDPGQNPVFAVEPRTVVGIVEAAFTSSATRWTFAG
jgi:PPOX class probable F420-dependent enzyme